MVIAHWSIGAGREIAIIAHWSIGAGAGGGSHCLLVNRARWEMEGSLLIGQLGRTGDGGHSSLVTWDRTGDGMVIAHWSIGARQEMAIIAQWSIGAGREIVRSVLISQLGRMGYGRVIAHWSIGAGQEIAIIAHWSIGAGAGGGGHCVLVNRAGWEMVGLLLIGQLGRTGDGGNSSWVNWDRTGDSMVIAHWSKWGRKGDGGHSSFVDWGRTGDGGVSAHWSVRS